MTRQTTSTLLMIEPIAFTYNSETAVNNYFQQKPDESAFMIQQSALYEFREMVELLRIQDIQVIVVRDTPEAHTPDSIFPNNWVSFHENSCAVLYPMFAENRRRERRTDLFEILGNEQLNYPEILALNTYELQGMYLEGTGSMVLDRQHRIAYTALSERTNPDVLEVFCREMSYTPLMFSAFQQVDNMRLPIYHTNVLMSVAEQYAVICLECIDKPNDRQLVENSLKKTGKTIIEISEAQLHQFAGNMLQVRNLNGDLRLIMSASAYDSLTAGQLEELASYNGLVVCNVPTIETYGGGSVRCMMAELF